jgi:hypothetical protein
MEGVIGFLPIASDGAIDKLSGALLQAGSLSIWREILGAEGRDLFHEVAAKLSAVRFGERVTVSAYYGAPHPSSQLSFQFRVSNDFTKYFAPARNHMGDFVSYQLDTALGPRLILTATKRDVIIDREGAGVESGSQPFCFLICVQLDVTQAATERIFHALA